MSAAEKISKLESLLERIQQNRVDAPVRHALDTAAHGAATAEPVDDSPVDSTVDSTLGYDAPVPTPAVPASALVGAPRAKAPTPMEQAVSTELELGPLDDEDDEPELEISYPDEDEPDLLLDSAEAAAFDAVEPLVAAEPELELDTAPTTPPEAMPTAPVHTRAPELEPEPEPARIDVAAAQPSTPIARVVSRPTPRTFGELLERALALRPR